MGNSLLDEKRTVAHICHEHIGKICAAAKLAHRFIQNNLAHTVEMLQLDKWIAGVESLSQNRDLRHGRSSVKHDLSFFPGAFDEQRLPFRLAHALYAGRQFRQTDRRACGCKTQQSCHENPDRQRFPKLGHDSSTRERLRGFYFLDLLPSNLPNTTLQS